MSIRIMSQVWGSAKADGNSLLVLLALADFADDDGLCWPSMATIARKARVSERGARGIIRRLEDSGLLICKSSKGRAPNKYQITTNPEVDAGLNPEAVTGLNSPNPEDSDTQPGSLLPPNLKRTTKRKRVGKPTPKKPADFLQQTLGTDMAGAVIEHRQRIGKPLTARAAEMLARQFAQYHDPPAGAEMMLARGWQGFKAEWMDTNRQTRGRADDRSDRKTEMARRQDNRSKTDSGVVDEACGGDAVTLFPAPNFG